MPLDPHHLQQGDRSYRALLDARVRATTRYWWGFTGLVVDEDRLHTGTLRLERAEGIMSDGLPFAFSEVAAAPEGRQIAPHFSERRESIRAYLVVPSDQPGRANVRSTDESGPHWSRFLAHDVSVVDETTGHDERTIEVGRPEFRVLFHDELEDGIVAMPVADLKRAEGGGFELVDSFVPPCLSITASARLTQVAEAVRALLLAKRSTLRRRVQGMAVGQATLTASDTVTAIMSTIVARYITHLNHLLSTNDDPAQAGFSRSSATAEQLFVCLSGLAAELQALPVVGGRTLPASPAYDHDDPAGAFTDLHQTIRKALDAEIEQNYEELDLAPDGHGNLVARDASCLANGCELYLVAEGDMPRDGESRFSSQVRVSATSDIEQVRAAFAPALPLRFTPRPPPGAPQGETLRFFEIVKEPTFWDAVTKERQIAVYCPPGLHDGELRLIAVGG